MNATDNPRLIVVGRNSKVWKRILAVAPPLPPVLALGHADVAQHRFASDDIVWIFSYSRHQNDNLELMSALASAGAEQCVYLSTATVNVLKRSRCFGYPRAKADAEDAARRILGAHIVRIGLVYEDEGELPAGINAATSLAKLSAALRESITNEVIHLFDLIERPFHNSSERMLYRLYGRIARLVGRWPCLLRPLDLVLKTAGLRWYGYFYLSNQLWLQEMQKTAHPPAPAR